MTPVLFVVVVWLFAAVGVLAFMAAATCDNTARFDAAAEAERILKEEGL